MLNTRQVSKKKNRSNARNFPALECRGHSCCYWNTQGKGRQDRLRPYSFTNSISWQRLPSTLVRKKTILQCRESAELDVCIVWNSPLIYPNYRQIYLDLPYLKNERPFSLEASFKRMPLFPKYQYCRIFLQFKTMTPVFI